MERRHVLALGCLATLMPWGVYTEAAAADVPLLLARNLGPHVDPANYLISEKFDGVRAVWDGERLRFRSGNTVPAPSWFIERLPSQALDGELWLGRGRFEATSALLRRAVPVDADWRELRYLCFELPEAAGPFAERAERLQGIVHNMGWNQLAAVDQSRVADRSELQARLQAVLRAGGEGLMLHRLDAPYHTGRSDALLKLKPFDDAEAVVIAHLPGKGRHEGRLGALRVRATDGREFNIGSGFTDAERDEPPPVGSVVTYIYQGLTAKGQPRFARFMRLAVGY
ncbi:DNA ligase [Leptothrix ochracea]|uniref:DNA ligase n=1 Tax=Leptothrix ochracea TaxID=735331 RepID=UPI0034E24ABB